MSVTTPSIGDMNAQPGANFNMQQWALAAESAASQQTTEYSTDWSILNQYAGAELTATKQMEELEANTASATASVSKTWSSMAANV
jgi:hypothetical protein